MEYNYFSWRNIIIAILFLFSFKSVVKSQNGELHVSIDSTGIGITEKEHVLDQIVVTSNTLRTKVKGSSIETRVVGSVLEHAGTAEDVLARTPGIIRQGEELLVIGKGRPLYYINGRKVQNPDELKRLNSEQIKSIEVISNPGVGYDASVNAVVRLTTIRQQGEGFGFDLNNAINYRLQRGHTDPYGSLNLNYRHKGLDFFAGGSVWGSHYYQLSDIGGGTFKSSIQLEQTGNLNVLLKSVGYDANFGTNWQINNQHSIGLRVNLSGNPYYRMSKLLDETIILNGRFSDHISSQDKTRHDIDECTQVNIYYNGQVGKVNIDWNVDFVDGETDESAEINEQTTLERDAISAHTYRHNDLVATKLVFSVSHGKGTVKVGTEDTYVLSRTRYSMLEDLLPRSSSSVGETTIGIFSEYSIASAWGLWTAGLRFEHVRLNYRNLMSCDDKMLRKQSNVFPSLSWSRSYGPWKLSLVYAEKTTRPTFWQLRDALQYHSRFVFESGNPTLRNTVNNSFSAKANYHWLIMGVDYLHAARKIVEWAEPFDDKGAILLKNQNLVRPVKSYSFYAIANPTIGCWSPNYTAGVTKQFLTLNLTDDRFPSGVCRTSFNRPMFLFYANNAFRIEGRRSGLWQFELNMQYRSKMDSDNTYLLNDIWSLDAALQKTFLDGNLTLRLTAFDLLRHMVENGISDFGDILVCQTNDHLSQKIGLSIHYRFNTARSKYRGSGAGIDAKNRLQ